MRVPIFSRSSWPLVIFLLIYYSCPHHCEVYLIVVLNCISLMTNDVDHLFMYLYTFLEKCLFKFFAHFSFFYFLFLFIPPILPSSLPAFLLSSISLFSFLLFCCSFCWSVRVLYVLLIVDPYLIFKYSLIL